jgi:hypothetical protein
LALAFVGWGAGLDSFARPRARFDLRAATGGDLAGLFVGVARAQDVRTDAPQRKDDHVYRYRGANGREVFTNAGAVAVHGEVVAPIALPELKSVDFAGASASQLQQLDRSVQRAHDELQTGQRCQAIRASLRVPISTFVWHEHLRELAVAIGLLASALVVFAVWGGRLRGLMPIAPLLGCSYLGYATVSRIDHRMDLLRDGLHACSSDLPAPEASNPETIKGRLATASSLQATVDRAYSERAAMADRIMRER